jgi:hypothetical protein
MSRIASDSRKVDRDAAEHDGQICCKHRRHMKQPQLDQRIPGSQFHRDPDRNDDQAAGRDARGDRPWCGAGRLAEREQDACQGQGQEYRAHNIEARR